MKESSLFKCWSSGRWETRVKAHLHISVEAEDFIRRERENRTKRSREGAKKFSLCRQAQSIPIRQVMVRYASSWCGHPGSTLMVSKSPGTRIPEGQRLYLLKLVPRILIQTCCLSLCYILVRVSTYRNNVKRMLGWVTISHSYNFLLLQKQYTQWPALDNRLRSDKLHKQHIHRESSAGTKPC